MKRISDYRRYLQLSAAIFLDKITPTLLGLLIIMLIARFGTRNSSNHYAMISSIYYACIALGLSSSTGIKFYIAKYRADQLRCGQFLASSLAISVLLAVLSSTLFIFFAQQKISDCHIRVIITYGSFIGLTAIYFTLTAINEAMQKVSTNNISNGLIIPLFLITFFFMKKAWPTLDMNEITARALVASHAVMIGYLLHQRQHWPNQLKIPFIAIKQLLLFGLPYGFLLSTKKYIISLFLFSLKPLATAVVSWQITIQLSLYWSFLGCALAGAFLVRHVGEDDPQNRQRLLRFLLWTLLGIALITVPLVRLTGRQVIDWLALNPQVTAQIMNHINLLTLFLLSEMCMTCLVGFCCSRKDTWRPRALWTILLLLIYGCYRQQATYTQWVWTFTGVNLLVTGLFLSNLYWNALINRKRVTGIQAPNQDQLPAINGCFRKVPLITRSSVKPISGQ